jgi:chaperone modulatory protein CbpM
VDGGTEQPVELGALARRAGVRVSLVRRYLAFGLFDPNAGSGEDPRFAPSCAARVATAERLRRDLGLNFAGAVLACELLDRISELEERVRRTPGP